MLLIAWRPKLLSFCLIVMLLNTTLTIVPSEAEFYQASPPPLQLLDGWCYALKVESRSLPLIWSRQQSSLSEHQLKILMIWQWIGIVVSVCLSGCLLLELIPHSGPTWKWLLLLGLSHKLVTDLQSQRERWLNLLHTEAALVLESQQLMTLARMTKVGQNDELLKDTLETLPNDKLTPESQNATDLSASCALVGLADDKRVVESQSVADLSPSQEETLVASAPDKQALESQNVADLSPSQEDALVALPKNKQAPESQNVADLSPGEEMVNQLAKLVIDLPTGTNLGMLHFLWMMVSGHLLASRGALFPGLQAVGLEKEAVRRSLRALGANSWRINSLLAVWKVQVMTNKKWKEHSHQGYHAKAVDLTAFWRPTLQNCKTKHYSSQAGLAKKAVVLGIVARVGDINGQRVPLPIFFVRPDEDATSESDLEKKLVQEVHQTLAENEIAIYDAGFSLSFLIERNFSRFVIRLPKNFVALRNYIKEYKGRGRYPEYGETVRPRGRKSKTRWIEATPPDQTKSWHEGQIEIRAEIWENLVQNGDKPGAKTFNVFAIHDSRFKDPWILATDVKELTAETVRKLYQDRWPVEQLPLAAKQMLGAHRQFVWSEENQLRLPELSLLAASVLTHVAASLPPIPTGFWDRAPKATPGRLRRFLNYQSLDMILAKFPLPARIRKKASRTDHLKTGHSARRAGRAVNTA